jgi:hypothetical protein
MGSEISKAYDIDLDTWTATGGHQSMWKIFPAVSKKLGHQCSGTAQGAPPSPRSSACWGNARPHASETRACSSQVCAALDCIVPQLRVLLLAFERLSPRLRPRSHRANPCAVFVFNKDDLKQVDKKDRESILGVLRRDMAKLRTLHHPSVLKVYEVFEENKSCLAFVTERVFCSLANACKDFTNLPADKTSAELRQFTLSPFEITSGLLHITEALVFLARDGRAAHLNVSPSSIFVTPQGTWKLGGFGFCATIDAGGSLDCPFFMSAPQSQSIQQSRFSAEPDLNYASPEMTGGDRRVSHASDIFALGCIAWELFRPLRHDGSTERLLDVSDRNPLTHQYKIQQLFGLGGDAVAYDAVPQTLQQPLRLLLAPMAQQRPQAAQFLQCPFFSSGPVRTMRFLKALPEKDQGTQAQFLAQLPPHLAPFPPRLLRDQVLPPLLLVATNQTLAPFVLPCLLLVAEKLEPADFMSHLAEPILPLLKLTTPAQCAVSALENLKVLVTKAAAHSEYKTKHLVPILLGALDGADPKLQNSALKQIPDIAKILDYGVLKKDVLPRVNSLMWKCSQLATRVNCLMVFAKTYQLFDKTALLDTVLPSLEKLAKSDKTPAVTMCILGCFEALGKHFGPELQATRLLPALAPMLWEPALNQTQFEMVASRAKDMIAAIAAKRGEQLAEQSTVANATKVISGSTAATGALPSQPPTAAETAAMFAAPTIAPLQTSSRPRQYSDAVDRAPSTLDMFGGAPLGANPPLSALPADMLGSGGQAYPPPHAAPGIGAPAPAWPAAQQPPQGQVAADPFAQGSQQPLAAAAAPSGFGDLGGLNAGMGGLAVNQLQPAPASQFGQGAGGAAPTFASNAGQGNAGGIGFGVLGGNSGAAGALPDLGLGIGGPAMQAPRPMAGGLDPFSTFGAPPAAPSQQHQQMPMQMQMPQQQQHMMMQAQTQMPPLVQQQFGGGVQPLPPQQQQQQQQQAGFGHQQQQLGAGIGVGNTGVPAIVPNNAANAVPDWNAFG